MTRWLRFTAAAINDMPALLVVPMAMFCLWACVAEIYAAAVWAHYDGGLAVLGLVGFDVLSSWLLVYGFLKLANDLWDLRLPKHRQVLAGALTIVLGLIFVAPCAFVWAVSGSAHDIFMVEMGSVAGTAGALLGRLRSRVHPSPGVRFATAAAAPSVPAQFPKPWRAVRVALGPPYAPASWQRRLSELALLGTILAGLPLLVLLLGGSLQPRAFTVVLHASEFVGFVTAFVLCWVWPLTRLVAVFNLQNAAPTELALLPGLGTARQQLRRMYLVALSIPAASLVVLFGIALGLAALEHLPEVIYIKLAAQFLLAALIAIAILTGQIANPRARSTGITILMTFQIWTLSFVLWTSTWHVPDSVAFRWLTAALVLVVLMLAMGTTLYSLRKLLRRPHLFVEISA
jgi:hypothetical protein